jgi:CBS domain-containing protein
MMPTAISEVMTRDVSVVSPQDNVQQAAQMMAQMNVGVVPVCNGKRLVGIVTDRDITIRATAAGKAPDSVPVSDVMSDGVFWLFGDQTVGEALQHMGQVQVRRLPVVDRHSMELIGIVSLGDLAARVEAHTDKALEEISFPSAPIPQVPPEDKAHRTTMNH